MNRDLLEQPFPENLIRTRQGGNGKTLSYVPTAEYIRRLCAASETWDFEITEYKVLDDEVIVIGKLTIDGVVKMAVGASNITRSRSSGEPVSIGQNLKSASSDSLKRACRLLSLGLHLWDDEQPHQPQRLVPRPTQPTNSTTFERLTQRQLGSIWSLSRRIGYAAEDIRARCQQAFAAAGPEQLSKHDASALISQLGEELDSSRAAS